MNDALPVPPVPALTRELGSPRFDLERHGDPAADDPFTVSGARARVTGGHGRGVDEARASARGVLVRLLSGLRIDGATATSSVLTPVGLERRLRVGDHGVLERIVVPRSDPVCFFEWVPESDFPVTLSWRVPTRDRREARADERGAEAVGPRWRPRWRTTDRALAVASGSDRALYILSLEPEHFEVSGQPASSAGPMDPPGSGALRVTARLAPAGRPVRLAVVPLAANDDEARILRVTGRTHVVVPARQAAAHRVMRQGLAVDAPDAALGEALAWARLRLDGWSVPAGPEGSPLSDRDVRLVLAALVGGDPGPARAVLAAPAPGHTRDDIGAADAARHLIVAGRYLACTGDLPGVQTAWKGLRARAERCLEAASAGPASGLVPAALRAMAVTAEEAGDGELTDRLRAAAGERPESAVGPHIPIILGTGEGAGDVPDVLLRSAALIESVVHGLLGADPDATRGRLVLRPRLPATWTRFSVRNLAVGEAGVGMTYDRTDAVHRFTLRQASGGAPVRVIFEPELEGARLASARVDGEPAELDAVAAEGRIRAPVQVVLDHERRVEVEIARSDR